MMLSSMKICVPLLCGLCVLFSVESMTTSRPETSNEITVELNSTTRNTPAHVKESQPSTLNPTQRYAEVSNTAALQMTELPTGATENNKTNSSYSGTDGLVTMSTATATTSSKSLGLTAESTAKNEAQPSPAVTTAASKAQHSPAVTTAASKAQHSPAATTVPGAAQPSHNTTITDTTKTAGNQSHQPSTPSFVTASATASTVLAGTVSVSFPHTTSTHPESASALASTSSLEKSTQTVLNVTQNLSSTTSTTTNSANPTSEEAFYHYPSKAKTSTSAEHLSTSHFNSATSIQISSSKFPDTVGSSSTTTDYPSSTTYISNSTAGILYPKGLDGLPVPTTRSAPATTAAPKEGSKSSPTNEAQPCSTRGVVKQCLIVIAALAALATIFMVSTIVLCAKLSARKSKLRRPQQATEMMCISSLLPERNHAYTRQRNPITNGVLVFPGAGDSDEDGGDNLTLSSFLPENDRYV
ncbi:P-selectin glycoprotein ligand 1 [Melanotaenia boesemani]|uniref:P-selectin glycoprotein ligand 1 n=1 Tax=Melanotaenia boesemani TaxID=1250792 RepID=UPI001C0418DD|nr:P-selectin glycoprotein ligand 1 [Melanotaenia boesemani]XP_041825059.1 P-selectin glycoprotein ligand 1 [Melanotaenia boesemani]